MKKILLIVIVLFCSIQVFSQSFRQIEYHTPDELIEILQSEDYRISETLSDLKGTKLFKVMIFYNGLTTNYRIFMLVNQNGTTDAYAIWDLDRKSKSINFDNDNLVAIKYGEINSTTFRIILRFENGENLIVGTIDCSYNPFDQIFSWKYVGDNGERYTNHETHIINL